MVYVLTKGGYAFVFDIGSGALLFRNKVSQDSIFIATYSDGRHKILLHAFIVLADFRNWWSPVC